MMAWISGAVKEIVVYRSLSENVFANLAFEDWIFKHVDLSFRRILFLWRNSPCVVVGRHQNPWVESNVPLLRERGVELVRRRSGGGTVYHDMGNLNCTVFTQRQDYNRPRNLQLVCDAVNQQWDIHLHGNKKDDIICNDRWKVSGSSAKLMKNSAYHHFTLLLDVDMDNLRQLLKPSSKGHISQSSATASVRSNVINLCSVVPAINYADACTAIAEQFYDVHRVTDNRKVIDIDPTSDGVFPGITDLRNDLQQWDWLYGKTPKFTVTSTKSFEFADIELTVEVHSGIINQVTMDTTVSHEHTLDNSSCSTEQLTRPICSALQGLRYWHTDASLALRPIMTSAGSELNTVSQWILDSCVL